MKQIRRAVVAVAMMVAGAVAAQDVQPVVDLVDRVCGAGASSHFTFKLDESLNQGKEAFQLSGSEGSVTVTGNTLSALTTGLNWYLNHDARVNISWNNLRQTPAAYPAPADKSVHVATGKWRYYLNYCTFSYSMSFWDEERWMKEVDWMALHGVNLPLQIVGVDAVWYYMLREQFGFSHDQASAFVAGPAHQGWWLMNNLIGHGGANPEWWYERQKTLGRKITDRMRELGMTPCLPGYVGMAPQKYVNDTGVTSYSGTWCGFTTPLLIAPGAAYTKMAEQYYAYIKDVYGFMPTAFSIDPCHERGIPSGMDYASACSAARTAMNAASPNALWVAQEWQTNADQSRINALPDANTLLLDLSSERLTYKNRYGAKEYLFCMLHNYGGNIGMYGCMKMMLDEYRSHLSTGGATGSNGTLVGVGATPEGIETNALLYDLLFELPWLGSVPDGKAWLDEYTVCRYGVDDNGVKEAWDNLRTTVYASTNSNQQGCREPVFCARPNLKGDGASSWAGASYNWDKSKVIEAAEKLLAATASGTNYEYDVVDFVRQAVTDYAHTLQMDMATQTAKGARFAAQADAFLAMMDDIDALLGTVPDLRMGKWAGAARQIAADAGHAADANWLEANARMLVTTWGNTGAATNQGGLRDYGNREWQGLVRDYYKPRWVRFFDDMKANGSCGVTAWQWMTQYELPYVYGREMGKEMSVPTNSVYADAPSIVYSQTYTAAPEGNPKEVAATLFAKYFGRLANGKYYSPWVNADFSSADRIRINMYGKKPAEVLASLDSIFVRRTTGSAVASYMFDENMNGTFDDTERKDGSLPSLVLPNVKCRITTSDGARIIVMTGFDGSEGGEDPAWPAVTANGDRTGINAENQCLKTITVNGTTVYTHSGNLDLSNPADGPGIIIDSSVAPYVRPGQTVTVGWTGQNMQSTRLSAYFDRNANHEFEHTTAYSECLGYIGVRKGNYANTQLNNCSITFQIPEDIPYGVTCLRLRFDGGWMETVEAQCMSDVACPNLESPSQTNYPVKPDYSTNRTVYDVHLMVADIVDPVAPWSHIAETGGKGGTSEEGKVHDSGAWLTSLAIGETEVFANDDANPVQTVVDAGSVVLNPGKTYNVSWTANDQMIWARLTAYLDANGDGEFAEATTASAGDCVGVLGGYKPSSTTGNAMMPAASFSLTVPADATLGKTCLRLRFDDAWQDPTGVAASVADLGGGASKVQPMLATSRSSRNVYDVHLTISKEDAISCPMTPIMPSSFYNLNGQRVLQPKGLVIGNARKAIVN